MLSFISCWRRVATALVLAATPPAFAQTALEQVPGYYRQNIGNVQLTALFDGVTALKVDALKGIEPERSRAWLAADEVPQTDEGVQTAVNAYLLRLDGELVLVDAGTAACFGPTLGQVASNLRAAGVRAQDIQHVFLTHAHPDHLCGLLAPDGTRAYPRATVWLDARDATYWLTTTERDRAPEAMRPLFDMARRAVAPYQAAGRFNAYAASDALPAGIQAVDSHGHTPGHTSWLIGTGNPRNQVLVWGDIVHYHSVQLREPSASFEYDTDRRQAVASRRQLLAQADANGWWIAGAHMPFPGLGHVRRDGPGYRWIPTEFVPGSP